MRLIDADKLNRKDVNCANVPMNFIDTAPTVEAIPKVNVYKAIQEMMKYEHEGFINISLTRLDEILKKCGVVKDDRLKYFSHILCPYCELGKTVSYPFGDNGKRNICECYERVESEDKE